MEKPSTPPPQRKSKGESGGFVTLCREVARPFPQWVDITTYFMRPDGTLNDNIGPYRKLARTAGCVIRRKNGRILVALEPGRSEAKQRQSKFYITPPHGDFIK